MPRLIASFLGSGLILGKLRGADSGSGTVAALLAGLAAYALGLSFGWPAVALGALVLTGLGFWATSRLDVGDAGWIVIDEAAGIFVALVGVIAWPAALTSFVVFRLADIYKRWFPGVESVDRLPGSWGIMGDDLVAAMYGLAAGHLIQWWLT